MPSQAIADCSTPAARVAANTVDSTNTPQRQGVAYLLALVSVVGVITVDVQGSVRFGLCLELHLELPFAGGTCASKRQRLEQRGSLGPARDFLLAEAIEGVDMSLKAGVPVSGSPSLLRSIIMEHRMHRSTRPLSTPGK